MVQALKVYLTRFKNDGGERNSSLRGPRNWEGTISLGGRLKGPKKQDGNQSAK
jgi:hypothetical protein